jgi:hypothetical protein
MSEPSQQETTTANENHVRAWVELSGFSSERLDSPDGKSGTNADWKFTKDDLIVFCEIKTIFSAGQIGLTKDQHERNRLEAKRKLDEAKDRLPPNTQLIVNRDYLTYLEARTNLPEFSIVKEQEFNEFLVSLKARLLSDNQINRLPFCVTISAVGSFVPHRERREELIIRLVKSIVWVYKNLPADSYGSIQTIELASSQGASDGDRQQHLSIGVILLYLEEHEGLDVNFLRTTYAYNELAIQQNIEKAIYQLRASVEKHDRNTTALPTIAFWSESNELKFDQLLFADWTRTQLGYFPQRYYLFDWAFEEYEDLAAIILFTMRPLEERELVDGTPVDEAPYGKIIANPRYQSAEETLKRTMTQSCTFLPVISKPSE